MTLLRVIATMIIGMGGAYLGVVVAESTLAAWWMGIATLGLTLAILEGI